MPTPPSTNLQARKRLFGRGPRRIGDFSMIQPQRAKVSSAALRTIDEGAKELKRRVGNEWQSEAYTYAEVIGEVGFVVNLTAETVAMSEFQAQIKEPDGSWSLTADERVTRVMEAFTGPQGGQRELKRRAALHLSIAGETILLGTKDDEGMTDVGVFWEFLSTEEVVATRGTNPVRRRDGGASEPIPAASYVARCWKTAPRFSDLAESSVKRVLKICNEILTLTDMIDAIARSRLAAGLLAIPEEITFVGDDESEEVLEDGLGGIDKFIEELFSHLTSPITDRTSAASLVPLVVRGPADAIDRIKLIDLARNLDTYAQALRKECLERLAQGMDIDPSLIEGLGKTNHWSGAQVTSEFLQKHVRPLGDLLVDFLTYSYLRPMLETYEGMEPAESATFRLVCDVTALQARFDEAVSSRVLHEMDAISDDSLRRANGFDSSDAPTETELTERRAWALLKAQPVALGPTLGPLVGLEGLQWPSATAAAPSPGGPPGVPAPGASGSPTKAAATREQRLRPVDTQTGAETPKTAVPALVVIDRLAVACDTALERAMERAGSRLVNKARKDVTLRDRVGSVGKKAQVLTMVRPTELTQLGLEPHVLFADAWDSLGMRARCWLRADLVGRGRTQLVADEIAALAATELCEALQTFAVEHLHRQAPLLDSGLHVPEQLVITALASAGVL
jgi:hypothetical protein